MRRRITADIHSNSVPSKATLFYIIEKREKMTSLWRADSARRSFKSLDGNRKTYAVIIGGGLAGLILACKLQSRGIEYILIEKNTICSGNTENTSAKITFQHGLIYNKLLKSTCREKALMYLNANKKAFEEMKELCMKNQCDFQEKDAYVYSLDNAKVIEDEAQALLKLGFESQVEKTVNLPFNIAAALKFPCQGQFNPLKFAYGISENLNICENTFAKKIKGHTVITDKGEITAEKIIITTHFPFINRYGLYSLKMYQHRSYITAYENGPDIGGMYVDEAMNGMSFRNAGNYLFIGGGDHRTGKKGGGFDEIRAFAKKYYPSLKEKYAWAAQDCITLDDVPYIGRYSLLTPDIYTAAGFNKWGMTTSMAAADILCDEIMGVKNENSEVFRPSRSILKPRLFANIFEAGINLLTPGKRCPHLGCALKWNKYEKTWDCPCHGSRFSENGVILDNPSQKNLKTKLK